jgi:hypothetical protein
VALDYQARDVRVSGRVAPALAAELEQVAAAWRDSLGDATA